jgi:hypothetical protein
LVVIDPIERNRDLAGIPHVALACLDQVLNMVAPPVSALIACEPYPFAADEFMQAMVNCTRVLPDWLMLTHI